MADCLICLLGHVKEVGKSIVTEAVCPPIKRNVGYWWFFEGNIQGLRDEMRSLNREKGNMDRKIEEARQRAESATSEAKDWLDEVAKNLEVGRKILQGCDELKPWNIISRYDVGKSAKKTADGIVKLRNEVESIRIADPAPPQSVVPIPHEPTMEFGSRGRIEADVMKFLNDEHARMVAICGAGGVGKTTMVRRIEERVRKVNLFDEVVHVVVSQQIDVLKIQKEIAESLRLPLIEDTLAARAHKLHMRLMDSKRKLIIFDDVWKRFNLTDFGVPSQNDFARCKIILTSRVEDACKKMNVQKIIRMEVLTKAEAWDLFKEKAGGCVEGSDLRLIAEDVAKECKGLPLALVIVGEALKEQSISVWGDSLTQLRRSIPTDFPEVLEDVYKPLKLSCDFLENESVKSLFLICCLFPEDYVIPIELLTLYSIGLGMLEGIGNIEEGRSRTHSFVEKLKSCFLLFDDRREHVVKMHDVVRDVAIFIGSKERRGFLKSLEVSTMRSASKDSSRDRNWMSIDMSVQNAKLLVWSDFPNLRLLIIRNIYFPDVISSQLFDANVICFKAMEELNVLSFSNIYIRSLPPTMPLLKQLTTLHLENSWVEDISVVGELASLEILCIIYCDRIEELPADIGRLKRLRLLELNGCQRLKRIVAGVISSLVGLEELKIIGCFGNWEAKGNESERRNAGLSELESLRSLTCLEIDICDGDLVAQELCLSQQLVRYELHFSEHDVLVNMKRGERHISLTLPGDITVGNWIHKLVRSTESLQLNGDGSNIFNLADIESLRSLVVIKCSTMNAIDCKFKVLEELKLRNLKELEEIIDGTIPEGIERNTDASIIEFPKLEELILDQLPNLAAFSQGNEIVEFPRLEYLRIKDCPKLRLKVGKCPNLRTIQVSTFNGLHHLLSSCSTREWSRQLEKLVIRNCDTIQELFLDEIEDEGNRRIIFAELDMLELSDLPCLTTFYRGVESIKFSKLSYMSIGNLPRLNTFLPMDSEPSHDHHSLHFFCDQKVEIPLLSGLRIHNLHDDISKIWCRQVPNNFFHDLRNLMISDVNGIRNLMSSSIAKNLVNLDHLRIESCKEMVEVVEDDEQVFVSSLFPKLLWVSIQKLQKLRSFCRLKHTFELPSLTRIDIADCPTMETFSLGSVSSPKLDRININGDEVLLKMQVLNDVIRDHFMKKSQEGDKILM